MIAVIIWMVIGYMTPGKSLSSALSVTTNWHDATSLMSNEKSPIISTNNLQESLTMRLKNFEGLMLKDPLKGVTRTFGPIRTTLPGMLTYTITLLIIVGMFFLKKGLVHKTLSLSMLVIIITTLYFGNYSIWGLNLWLMGILPLLIPVAVYLMCKLNLVFRLLFILLLCIEHFFTTWIKFGYETNINLSAQAISGITVHGNQLIIFLPYILVFSLYVLFDYFDKNKRILK